MINNVYTVEDVVAEDTAPVFEARNDGVAIRQFKDLLTKVPNPEEYVLWQVGRMDHDKKRIAPCEAKLILEGSKTIQKES